jgi:hypothetical protein
MMLGKMMKGGVPPKEEKYDEDDMKAGIHEESEEHPWLSPKDVKRLVMDHLAMDEEYYSHEEEESPEEESAEHKTGGSEE